MVYDNINSSDLLGKSMQHTDRSESQRLKPSPSHYLKQSHKISKPQTAKSHQKGDDLDPLNFTSSKWTAETWSSTNAWSRHQIAGSEMRKVHPEDTATGLSPNRYKQSELYSCLIIILRWPETFYVLMMLCTRGGKNSFCYYAQILKMNVFKSMKIKKNQIKILLAMSLLIFVSVDQNQQDLFS